MTADFQLPLIGTGSAISMYLKCLITSLQDDYLTEFEIVKMKALFHSQLTEIVVQGSANFAIAFALSYPLLGHAARFMGGGSWLRFPVSYVLACFFTIQSSKFQRRNEYYPFPKIE
jgi:hypothetical protein